MKILVVDDEASVRSLVVNTLKDQGYEIYEADSGREALLLSKEQKFDLVFCDVVMEGENGFAVLKRLRDNFGSQIEIILMTGYASVNAAIQAVQAGANDLISKPFSIDMLQRIAAAAQQRRLSCNLIDIPPRKLLPFEIIGNSPVIIEVVKNAMRMAATDLPVVICGPSGSGKELIARLIHSKGKRAHLPFLALNCGALPDALLEAELFGHRRGAFTGAGERRGLIEEADGGTLFLDEVTETSAAFQVKLLRVLQEGEFRPLGSSTRKQVNVRIISATNRDLKAHTESGAFRLDLLYRLQGVEISVPPLKDRKEDIRLLALAYLGHFNTGREPFSITTEALRALEQYDWPGNVRELRHQMQRLAAFHKGAIGLEDLALDITSAAASKRTAIENIPVDMLPSFQEVEAGYLQQVLTAVNGNKSRAAEVMGVDRKTLYRMIERHLGTGNGDSGKLADLDGELFTFSLRVRDYEKALPQG